MLIGLSTLAGVTALAGQPPDVVSSDSASNTAMGTDALLSITSGYQNTGAGNDALLSTSTGYKNTAIGFAALENNSTGYDDSAFGSGALLLNTTGSDDTGLGMDALYHNLEGSQNTAAGTQALYSNTTGTSNSANGNGALYYNLGSGNDATGTYALVQNTSGGFNTASGAAALDKNTVGNYNVAVGYEALFFNQSGSNNVGVGFRSLYYSTGSDNDAFGYEALGNLFNTSTGSGNTALGHMSMMNNTAGGSQNIAIGYGAGNDAAELTHGNNNIDIGSPLPSNESDKIRIGVNGTQTDTFIAGIGTAKVTGAAVYVTSSGQLGVLASSERYKTAIAPMGASTDKLAKTRPVIFHLKDEPEGAVQYGLIAEELDKLYPELVIRDANGVIQGVRYDELAPMLLNRLQQQQSIILAQADQAVAQDARIAEIGAREQALQSQLADVLKAHQEMRAAFAQSNLQSARLALR